MPQAEVRYEHPLNERMRSALRLEFLFDEFYKLQNEAHHRRALIPVICDLLSLLSRADCWSELAQDLQREIDLLESLRSAPVVDLDKLQAVVADLRNAQKSLSKTPTSSVRIPKLLLAVMQRASVPGGLAPADMPAYTHWLNLDTTRQQSDIHEWTQAIAHYDGPLRQYLQVVRSRASEDFIDLENHQSVLQCKPKHALFFVWVPNESSCYPEISGGRQRLSVRLRSLAADSRDDHCSVQRLRIALC